MRLIKNIFTLIIFIMSFFSCIQNSVSPKQRLQGVQNWVCCYNSYVPSEEIVRYDLAVLDPDAEIDIPLLKASSTKVVGYVSLVEVQPSRWYWDKVVGTDAVLPEKTVYGGFYADVRSQSWQQTVVDTVIPNILHKGFDGIFLDTIDSAEYLQSLKDGEGYEGMQEATVALIEAIRRAFPNIVIIANRGFAMLPDYEPFVDGLLAESVLTEYNPKTEKAALRDPAQYAHYLQLMTNFHRKGGLVLTLDYAINSSFLVQKNILKLSMKYDFIPYLSDPSLNNIYHIALENSYGD